MADPLDTDEVTIDDTILSTLRDIKEREGIDQPEEKVTAKPVAPEPKETKAERPRDETGKFAKTDSVAPEKATQTTSEAVAQPPEAAEPEAPLVTTTGQPLDINRPPASWKPAAKAQWAGLPEDIRKEVYRRESDFLNGNKGIKENADFGQQIKSVVEPYRMLIQAEGGTTEQAIAETLKTAALFRVGTQQQKLQALFNLDKQFNAGLAQHFEQQLQARMSGQQIGQQPQQPVQPFTDPRVDQILTSLQAQERQRAQQEEAVSNQATERFISAMDEKGLPKYPFVDNVLDDMAVRVSQIRRVNPSISHEQILEQAYDAAVWANPETRAVLIGQQQAAAQQPVANQLKTDQAKRASRLNVPKRGSLPAGEAVGTMDDTIRETYRQLAG